MKEDDGLINIPRSWFERLAYLSDKANAELEDASEDRKMYIHLHQLIGYSSSARTILALYPPKNAKED